MLWGTTVVELQVSHSAICQQIAELERTKLSGRLHPTSQDRLVQQSLSHWRKQLKDVQMRLAVLGAKE